MRLVIVDASNASRVGVEADMSFRYDTPVTSSMILTTRVEFYFESEQESLSGLFNSGKPH